MSVQPEKVYHINYAPTSGAYDIVDRISEGVLQASKEGFDWCFIIENDDYYPFNYFDRFMPHLEKYDFIGQDYSTYYNLGNTTYRTFNHEYRASLFTTAFRISALNNFEWPVHDYPFLDLPLWKYARHKRRKFIETGALGIKHGVGLCGGKGHIMRMKHQDEQLTYLKQHTDEIGFEFYRGMIEKLKAKV